MITVITIYGSCITCICLPPIGQTHKSFGFVMKSIYQIVLFPLCDYLVTLKHFLHYNYLWREKRGWNKM